MPHVQFWMVRKRILKKKFCFLCTLQKNTSLSKWLSSFNNVPIGLHCSNASCMQSSCASWKVCSTAFKHRTKTSTWVAPFSLDCADQSLLKHFVHFPQRQRGVTPIWRWMRFDCNCHQRSHCAVTCSPGAQTEDMVVTARRLGVGGVAPCPSGRVC